jgi:hypothetical protein
MHVSSDYARRYLFSKDITHICVYSISPDAGTCNLDAETRLENRRTRADDAKLVTFEYSLTQCEREKFRGFGPFIPQHVAMLLATPWPGESA